MNFLYPGFLFALFSIAIPVIIHLFNFRRFKKVYFSNVAFLKEIKEQNSSSERLKNLLILASRILAIIFLVLAFSRPFFPSVSKYDQSKGNIVSIYVDNSYSMEAVNKEGNLLDEAKRKAKEIVKTYQLNDRFQLLTNDFEGRHQRLLNADEILKVIDEVKISPANRQLQHVLNRQQSVFSGTSNRHSFIISDFQKGFAGQSPIRSDSNTAISLVKLNANHLPNVAVDSIWFLSPVHQLNATEKIAFRLRNYGEEEAKNIPVKVTIENKQVAISNVTIAGGETTTDTLSFSALTLGWKRGTVSIKDFPLTFDDELKFVFKVSAEQKVLSINGLTSEKYIKALFGADPYFKLTEMPETNIGYSSLNDYSLIILNGLKNPSTGLSSALKSYTENGGSVIIFPDLDADKVVYTQFLTDLNLPAVAELKLISTKVSSIELKNSLFKGVFESLPQKLDLPEVNRYFTFKENNKSNKENLLQLPANTIFFAKYPQQNGQIFLSATGLNDEDSNLARHPVFVPLIYKIAFASVKEQPLYYIAMKDDVVESTRINLNNNQNLRLVADNFEVIPEIRQSNGRTLLYTADQIKKAGFYDLKLVDSIIAVLAFNDNRMESDMHYDQQKELGKLFGKEQVKLIDPESDHLGSAVSGKNNGVELWKLCLILSIIFLAIEIVLVRFYHIKNYSNS